MEEFIARDANTAIGAASSGAEAPADIVLMGDAFMRQKMHLP